MKHSQCRCDGIALDQLLLGIQCDECSFLDSEEREAANNELEVAAIAEQMEAMGS